MFLSLLAEVIFFLRSLISYSSLAFFNLNAESSSRIAFSFLFSNSSFSTFSSYYCSLSNSNYFAFSTYALVRFSLPSSRFISFSKKSKKII